MVPPLTEVADIQLPLICKPRRDERLSWPGWLTYSGRFIYISCHPSIQSVTVSYKAVSNGEYADETDRRTDRRTDARPLHYAFSYGLGQRKNNVPVSSSANLHISRTNLDFDSRSFHIAATTVWNSLPSTLRSSQTINTFRKHVKNHLFQPAFNSP